MSSLECVHEVFSRTKLCKSSFSRFGGSAVPVEGNVYFDADYVGSMLSSDDEYVARVATRTPADMKSASNSPNTLTITTESSPSFPMSNHSGRETYSRDNRNLLVCITAYNESADDLHRSLRSLHKRCIEIGNIDVQTLVVLDGWHVTHPSMKEYIWQMFGTTDDNFVRDDPEAFRRIELLSLAASTGETQPTMTSAKEIVVTHPVLSGSTQLRDEVFQSFAVERLQTTVVQALRQSPIDMTWEVVEVQVAPKIWMKLTFIIKSDNRRKHNSHEWFLRGFAMEKQPDFVLLT
eukprot:gene20058-24013_t